MARVAALVLFFFLGDVWGDDPAPGRRIYLDGVTPSGEPLAALVGFGRMPLSGQAVACGNCHGPDGKGRPESSVLPQDITWAELTKPYGHSRATGRKYGAFDERTFVRAVNEGLDPAGNELDWSMPRYALSRAEAEALIAYIKRLGERQEPGVGERSLRIGVFLPEHASAPAMRAALAAYVEGVNRAGGIHQRRIELVAAGEDRQPVFALLGPSEPAGDAKLPTLVLQTSAPTLIYPRDELVFHVLPGLAEQAAVLVDFAARRAGPAPLRGAIVASGAATYDQAAQAAGGRCAVRGCGELVRIGWYAARFDAAAVVKRLKAEGREHLFFFGQDDEFEHLLDEAGRAMDSSWQPAVYAPGALARTAVALRERFGGGVFLAFPTSPLGRSENGARAWQQLRQEFGLGRQYEAAQMAALAAATVLTEGLRRAGRELSRERLVQALESLNNYDPQGYGPAVSFGPDRRTGALGGYVVELAPGRGFLPASGWIALD